MAMHYLHLSYIHLNYRLEYVTNLTKHQWLYIHNINVNINETILYLSLISQIISTLYQTCMEYTIIWSDIEVVIYQAVCSKARTCRSLDSIRYAFAMLYKAIYWVSTTVCYTLHDIASRISHHFYHLNTSPNKGQYQERMCHLDFRNYIINLCDISVTIIGWVLQAIDLFFKIINFVSYYVS